MRIALAQIDCDVGNLEKNCAKFAEYACRAKDKGCEVVIFPEMSDTGYVTAVVADCAQPWPGQSFDAARSASADCAINFICGISERENDFIYNSIAFFDSSGELRGKYRKLHLFSPAPVNEDKVCTPGSELSVIDFGGLQWGLSICYDLRFPELYRSLTLQGANVLLNCSAWPALRPTHWDHLTRARAIENQAFFVGVDRVGTDDELSLHGHSRVVTPMGEVLCEGGRNSETLLVAELNPNLIDEFRNTIPVIPSRRTDIYGNLRNR